MNEFIGFALLGMDGFQFFTHSTLPNLTFLSPPIVTHTFAFQPSPLHTITAMGVLVRTPHVSAFVVGITSTGCGFLAVKLPPDCPISSPPFLPAQTNRMLVSSVDSLTFLFFLLIYAWLIDCAGRLLQQTTLFFQTYCRSISFFGNSIVVYFTLSASSAFPLILPIIHCTSSIYMNTHFNSPPPDSPSAGRPPFL